MKVYLYSKSIDKLKKLIEQRKPGKIRVRRYKKGDKAEHSFHGLKLPEEQIQLHKLGKPYYINITKESYNNITRDNSVKEGGILPLIPIILGAIGTIAGVSTGIAKTVIDKKAQDAKLEEERRHNSAVENELREGKGAMLQPYKGDAVKDVIKDFIQRTKLDDVGKKALKSILVNLSDSIQIRKDGDGLFLKPY